jgi:prevent-host-death family protein
MEQVKITELRAHLPKYLGRIQQGESITVISRGKPIARLVPVNDVMESAQVRLASLRNQARVGDIVSPADVQWNVTHDTA